MYPTRKDAWTVYSQGIIFQSKLGTYDFQGGIAKLKELGSSTRPSRAVVYDKNWNVKSSWEYGENWPVFRP